MSKLRPVVIGTCCILVAMSSACGKSNLQPKGSGPKTVAMVKTDLPAVTPSTCSPNLSSISEGVKGVVIQQGCNGQQCGKPNENVDGARVSLSQRGAVIKTTTAKCGAFALAIGPGHYALKATVPQSECSQEQFEVYPGQISNISVYCSSRA